MEASTENGNNGFGKGRLAALAEVVPIMSAPAPAPAPENGASHSEIEVAEVIPATAPAGVVPDENARFAFRVWLIIPIIQFLKKTVAVMDLSAALAEGSGPKKDRDSSRIIDGWKKLKKLFAVVGDLERGRAMLLATLAGIEERVSRGGSFSFKEAANMTGALRSTGFGIAWLLNGDDRAGLTRDLLYLEENRSWFGLVEQVEAERHELAEKNRLREEARIARDAVRREEEKRMDVVAATADELGDFFAAATAVGVELTGVVSKELLDAAEARLPEAGEIIDSTVQEIVTKEDDGGKTFVVGILFARLTGRKEMPFLPARYIPDAWRRMAEESGEDYVSRLVAGFPAGKQVLLSVEKNEQDGKGRNRVLVQIRTADEVIALRNGGGRKAPYARPMRALVIGEELDGRVLRRTEHGVQVAVGGGRRLFCHISEVPEGLFGALSPGTQVSGSVIPGYAGREHDLAIREIIVAESDERDLPPEWIIHSARVEEIRQYVVDSGMELDEAVQGVFRKIVETASSMRVLSEDEQEAVHTFFGAILKDADRRFESVIVTLREYRREQEDRAEESQGEADSRPFCTNHEVEEGMKCDRRVAEEGKQCLRCSKRAQRHARKDAPSPTKKKEDKGGCRGCRKGNCRKHTGK